MRAVFQIVSGPQSGRSFFLRGGQTIKVGRTEWADFCLPFDERMSGVHFSVECSDEQCTINDLRSTNGTFVNGQTITSARLNDGDRVTAGDTTLQVELTIERLSIASVPPGQETPANALSETVTSDDDEPVELEDQSDDQAEEFRPPQHILAAVQQVSNSRRPYAVALLDPNPEVRTEALMAAVWAREPWLLNYCRTVAARPSADWWTELWLLAVLGQPSDLETILAVGRCTALGSKRFNVLASFGHPGVVRDLLAAMESPDANAAVAAAKAFQKITGAEVSSDHRATLPPEGPDADEFDREFAPQETMPDPGKARQHWINVKQHLREGTRWRNGIELTQAVATGSVHALDLEGQYEAYLRGRFEGIWNGRPFDFKKLRTGAPG